MEAAAKGCKVELKRQTGWGEEEKEKTQNSCGRDARRATDILLGFIFNDRTWCADRTEPKFRLFAGRKHSSVCAQVR